MSCRRLSLLSLVLSLSLWQTRAQTQTEPQTGRSVRMEASLAEAQATLSDMFREVERLMEDTQQKLEEAANEMDNESAKSLLYTHDLLPRYREEMGAERKEANLTLPRLEVNNEETNSSTDKAHDSPSLNRSSIHSNEIYRECIIDEDCPAGKYCLYEVLQSRCLPCKALDMPCTKDEECCGGELCLWGQCTENATKGDAGSICQYQSDCSPELCCAFHKALLFPVCTSKPLERERCHLPSNHLMELLSWDTEGEGPWEHCPCSQGFQCQPQGRGSLCVRPQNSSEELEDPLYSEMDYIV